MPSAKQLSNLKPSRPGQIITKRGTGGPIKSLTDCLIQISGEKHQLPQPDGTMKEVTFNEYVASAIKRIVAELLTATLKGEKVPGGLTWIHRSCFEIYVSRLAPLDKVEQALSDTRTLTVVISRESPMQVIEVKSADGG